MMRSTFFISWSRNVASVKNCFDELKVTQLFAYESMLAGS